jgi:hypothetical protein
VREGHRTDQSAAARLRAEPDLVRIVALACELTAWMQMLALTGSAARRWEPKRLRTRLFTVPATLARPSRRRLLHLADHHP